MNPAGYETWTEDARYVFDERIGIAMDLGMDTTPGSDAWRVALKEARRENAMGFGAERTELK